MNNKKIFIFGGTGSLGQTLIKKYINNNFIINYSRDENKQWSLINKYKSKNLINYIGDYNDNYNVKQALLFENPNIIIIASAMKHIDKCEFDVHSSYKNNFNGVKNVLDIISLNENELSKLECVCFISTDKACNPISSYGICKALSEKYVVSKAKKHNKTKFVIVRYGNVLNSRGSILEIIKNKIKSNEKLLLTNVEMTRFIMTLDESVSLIEYAILNGNNGETIIPKLSSMKIKDLIEIFCEKYNLKYEISGIRFIEKIHEDLINKTQSMYSYDVDNYYHIKAPFEKIISNEKIFEFTSAQKLLSKIELKKKLKELNFI